MVSLAVREMYLLVQKGTPLCSLLAQEIGLYQIDIPDVCTSSAVHVQYKGYVKSNGAYNSITVGDNYYNIKYEFWNGNGNIVFDFHGNGRHPLVIKWRDYHYNARTYILTAQIDRIRSFVCYINNSKDAEKCHKLVNILKRYVDRDVYQTERLFCELYQRVALLYKAKLKNSVVPDDDACIFHTLPNDLLSSEHKNQKIFLELSEALFDKNMLLSAAGWNFYMDPIVCGPDLDELVFVFKKDFPRSWSILKKMR